jgi:hypothetical protein
VKVMSPTRPSLPAIPASWPIKSSRTSNVWVLLLWPRSLLQETWVEIRMLLRRCTSVIEWNWVERS